MIHRIDLWLNAVDVILIDKVGLDHLSLEDYAWEDLYNEGYLPADAVDAFIADKEF